MRILVVGLGVIGSTYGYLFNCAGHKVEHLIRPNSAKKNIATLKVSLLDGRNNPKGEEKTANYTLCHRSENTQYDFIFVSVPQGGIENVIKSLDEQHILGSIILACGIWKERTYVEKLMGERKFVYGYPVAGGNMSGDRLTTCVFDHFMLDGSDKTNIENYDLLMELFSQCSIKAEIPFDMSQWIWIHMAINAGVVATAGKYGDVNDTLSAAENLMNSSMALSQAIIAIRECTKIIASRNVNLKKFNNELFAYKMPSKLAGIVMKKMFAGNLLTRKIMTLHNNLEDLLFVCQSVYDCGKQNNIAAPHFYSAYEEVLKDLK